LKEEKEKLRLLAKVCFFLCLLEQVSSTDWGPRVINFISYLSETWKIQGCWH